MQSELQEIHPPSPQVFQDSLDWRFLLPISDLADIYVALDEQVDFKEALARVGIPVSNRKSFSSLKQDEGNEVPSFVLPLGLPVSWVSARPEEQVELYRSIRRLICPAGYFLLGFRNSWYSRSNAQAGYHPSTPPRIVSQLNRAGFKSVQIFGAMPNLRIPEYIFELDAQAMYFALLHRFRRKPVLLNMLQILVRTVGLARVSKFFPCYFAVARV